MNMLSFFCKRCRHVSDGKNDIVGRNLEFLAAFVNSNNSVVGDLTELCFKMYRYLFRFKEVSQIA